MFGMFGMFGIGMVLFTVIFLIAFLGIVGLFIAMAVKQARVSAENRAAPEVTAVAEVVTKRIETRGGGETSVSQHHYVTFEQPGGERFELEVAAGEYGLLVEGDRGTVSMKGTRYLGFSRELLR